MYDFSLIILWSSNEDPLGTISSCCSSSLYLRALYLTMSDTIAIILIPLILTLIFAYMMQRLYLRSELKRKKLKNESELGETALRMRLQAMERMVLFLERIDPLTLVSELYQPGIITSDLQLAAIKQANKEYFHNMTQQLYIEPEVWQKVRDAKEESLAMINEAASQLSPTTNGKALMHEIANLVGGYDGTLPNEEAIQDIQKSVQRMLQF